MDKPFNEDEPLCRINAILWRCETDANEYNYAEPYAIGKFVFEH